MSAPLLVLVLASGSGEVESMLLQSAREALGAGARVELRTGGSEEEEPETAALVSLSWLDEPQEHAVLRVRRAGASKWIEQSFSFAAEDLPIERARTLGFAAASLVAPAPPAPPRERAPIAAVAAAPVTATVSAPPEEDRAAIYAAGVASTALGGDGSAFGGTLAAELILGSGWALRAGAALRFGEVENARSTSFNFTGEAGARWTFFPTRSELPLSLGVRADLFLAYLALNRLPDEGMTPARQSRWLPGADLMLEVGWALGDNTAIILAGGAEGVAGETTVFVRGRPVAVLPHFQVVAETGVRASF